MLTVWLNLGMHLHEAFWIQAVERGFQREPSCAVTRACSCDKLQVETMAEDRSIQQMQSTATKLMQSSPGFAEKLASSAMSTGLPRVGSGKGDDRDSMIAVEAERELERSQHASQAEILKQFDQRTHRKLAMEARLPALPVLLLLQACMMMSICYTLCEVINFMTNECGWGLHLTDGGNLGYYGQMRETQIKFKAPHPLNLMAPHIMIELRSVGYIEVNGYDTDGIYGKLEDSLCSVRGFVRKKWGGSRYGAADKDYCDLKFSTSAFKKRGTQGENNMGMKTMELVDFMTKECAWTLLTCTGGNYGLTGSMREQQMVFRNDAFVQHGEQHIMVELRDQGYVEINGLHDAPEAAKQLEQFYQSQGCKVYQPGFWESSEKYCDVKYQTPPGWFYRQGTTNNLGKRTIEVASYLGQMGWMLLLCNGGNIHSGNKNSGIMREQQVKFTKARPSDNPAAPLLMIELRTIPTTMHGQYQGFIEINGQNTNGVYQQVIQYMQQTMLCTPLGPQPYCDLLLQCNCFRLREASTMWHTRNGRLNGESNFGRYTMRLCDFMVDHLGEWDLIVCNGNSVDTIFRYGKDLFQQ
eukprot:s2345_g8.t1